MAHNYQAAIRCSLPLSVPHREQLAEFVQLAWSDMFHTMEGIQKWLSYYLPTLYKLLTFINPQIELVFELNFLFSKESSLSSFIFPTTLGARGFVFSSRRTRESGWKKQNQDLNCSFQAEGSLIFTGQSPFFPCLEISV